MKVRDVMTTDPITLETDARIRQAAEIMRDRDVGAVLVTKGGKLLGIVTDRDIVIRAVARGHDYDGEIGELCSATDVVTVTPEDDVDGAREAMRAKAVRRVPVVQDGQAVGIVSLGDLAVEKEPESVLGEISSAPPNA